MAKSDSPPGKKPQSAAPSQRGRGRPSLGKPVPVVMSDQERAIALEIGDGKVARGARTALLIVAAIGTERAVALAYPSDVLWAPDFAAPSKASAPETSADTLPEGEPDE